MGDKKSRLQTIKIILLWANVTVGILALCSLTMAGSLVAYGRLYENRIFPGVRVLGVRLDGLTKTEARKALQDAVDNALSKGLQFTYRGHEVSLDATTVSTDPDASRDLVHIDFDQALDQASELGRGSGWQQDMAEQISLRVYPRNIPAQVTVDRSAVSDALQANFQKDLKGVKDARLAITYTDGHPAVSVEAETPGMVLVTDSALDELERQAAALDFKPISLSDRAIAPQFTSADLEPVLPKIMEYLERPSLVFVNDKDRFAVPTSTLATWVSVTGTRGALELTLDQARFAADIKNIAKGVEQEGKTGSLIVKDGKIQSFVGGTEGVQIDAAATLNAVLAGWPATSTFPLVLIRTKPSLAGEDPEKLGIKELLGVGHSNFAGSPKNRRKNITRAIEILSGTIIQPGQVFSTIDTMGEIDGVHGWFPEMVIKGNETKPEFGGGLCQIGTTLFRGAMMSGLPIVERQNHSYRVRYYEPAGTDATVYGPHPDLRFRNDTGYPILINAYQKGDDLYFEFWGTSDGRKGEIGKSNVYNLTPPPPMKLVETLDLKPGKKKCSEIAHTGADADFTYSVTLADGTQKNEVFRSHYRPWQAVCMIGVDKLTQPVDTSNDSATSTVGN